MNATQTEQPKSFRAAYILHLVVMNLVDFILLVKNVLDCILSNSVQPVELILAISIIFIKVSIKFATHIIIKINQYNKYTTNIQQIHIAVGHKYQICE